MRLRPEKWTYEHSERMFHISLGICFTIMSLVAFSGGVYYFGLAKADDTQSQNLQLQATVGDISPGPTQISGGNIPPQKTLQAPTLKFDIQLQDQSKNEYDPTSERYVIAPDGSKVLASVYKTNFPLFKGHTSIPNAIVTLDVISNQNVHASTQADSSGYWSWQSPESIPSGQHTVYASATDPTNSPINAQASLEFFINMPADAFQNSKSTILIPAFGNGGILFDIQVKIPDQYKTIAPGDQLLASIKLINFGQAGHPVDVGVEYIIQNKDLQTILDTKETLAVATQISYLKSFYTLHTLPEGQYTLIVRVPSQNEIAVSSDTFSLKGQPVIAITSTEDVNFTVVFQSLIALFLLFLIISYFEYNKAMVLTRTIQQISEKELLNY